MNNNDELRLRDPGVTPASEVLEQVLGSSYAAYKTFQDVLPKLEIEQEWQWYTPHKAWFARGQHWWTTSKGTRKEKNLYWLHVCEGYFCVTVWFKEKNRMEILKADVSRSTKQLIHDAKTMGKVPTFPVRFGITATKQLADVCTLIECKKRLER